MRLTLFIPAMDKKLSRRQDDVHVRQNSRIAETRSSLAVALAINSQLHEQKATNVSTQRFQLRPTDWADSPRQQRSPNDVPPTKQPREQPQVPVQMESHSPTDSVKNRDLSLVHDFNCPVYNYRTEYTEHVSTISLTFSFVPLCYTI